MSELELRPRFRIEVNNTENEVVEIVKKKLKEDNSNSFESTIIGDHLILRINKEKRHYWSPQMDISLETKEDGGTIIRCLLAPEPAVWTMFMFFYIGFGGLTLVGTVYGSSQQILDMTANGYWYALLGGIGLVVTFIASQVGQKMGEEQTNLFLKLIEKAFDKCECT